ncbi:hypothetical protein BDN70DRAFT_873108 [Pholiota conissans]|uniref:Uncharacterized protein n=1 Tax=Pholiota conissans TaxID=109636 RepID=A0A9P5ZB76_9AGAR|nr:hypothetical protein BDN70DRAFT_873108 [Pholiota conissans]
MADNEEWAKILNDHPIFSLPRTYERLPKTKNPLELSTNTLPDFTNTDPQADSLSPSGRRQVMMLKDTDLIVAVGKEIRMSSFGDLKLSHSIRRSYKTLHTPNIQFEIHQIALNPTGKLLAVAGAFQVAVIVLPRPGYSRLVPDTLDCKSVQVGQFYHASTNSAPIAKIDWHPWGEAGSTLLVMTVDGKLREYDISNDTEEPQQVVSFVSDRKTNSFMAVDVSEREVASFTFGKGRADWGPLTLYAVMKSGDIYSICPYMPQNASIPSSYITSLEYFISAKQYELRQAATPSKNLSTLYDYHDKYVTALLKQLPPGTIFPAASKSVQMHPPTTIKASPLRQGPFLLQPSPRTLQDSEGGDATDIIYLSFGAELVDNEDDAPDTEHMGIILVSYQDGRVDFFFDVEKVEARWDTKQIMSSRDLPMLAVYESIDLGLVKGLTELTSNTLSPLTELLQANHPVFLSDPLHDDLVYVYHAFGVHVLDIAPVLESLSTALREETEDESILKKALERETTTNVRPILSTFSVERKCSNPVIAVAIPNDVYLTYCILILTSALRVTTFPLNVRMESSPPVNPKTMHVPSSIPVTKSKWLIPLEGPPSYVSFLGPEPYVPPSIVANPSGLPSIPTLSLPSSASGSKDFMLTPDTLRFMGKSVAEISSQVNTLQINYRAGLAQINLQKRELLHQVAKCKEMEDAVEQLKGGKRQITNEKFAKIEREQKDLLARLDRLLQALMRKASPELSEHENKWFEELKRMKEDILGRGRYDEDSLASRTLMLEKEYARLLPSLQALTEKESEWNKKHLERSESLGFSQAFEYGQRSNVDQTQISAIENEIIKLATKLDVALVASPSPTLSPPIQ